nr:hypothetical protein [uncultured Sphaerochaeta sp.]
MGECRRIGCLSTITIKRSADETRGTDPQDVAEEGKDFLIERGYSIRMGRGTDKASLLADIQDVDAVLFRNEAYDADILEAAKRVTVLARHGLE